MPPDAPAAFAYSIRMRAAAGGPHEQGGRHVSGWERLVLRDEVAPAVLAAIQRGRAGGEADFLSVTVERVPLEAIARAPVLPVTSIPTASVAESRAEIRRRLARAGVGPRALAAAEALFASGSAMRGAALLDAETGARLDADRARGVRVSRVDYAPEQREAILASLRSQGLTHHRVAEAVALASKTIWAGALAEVGWSDDPEYVAGYVATEREGYVRFPAVKEQGDTRGVRVILVVRGSDQAELMATLERRTLWLRLDAS